MYPEDEWQRIVSMLRGEPESRIIYVIGECDTGKTTFARYLLDKLSGDYPVGYLDCDPGQSQLGPPGTVGLSITLPNRSHQRYLYFVGATSPAAYIKESILGIKRCLERAKGSEVQRLIADSSGFVLGSLAESFQRRVLDLLQPDAIMVLTREAQLRSFLEAGCDSVVHVPVSRNVEFRTTAQRKMYREKRFGSYLKGGALRRIVLEGEKKRQILLDLLREGSWRNLLVAIRDAEDFVLALGIVEGIEPDGRSLLLYCPEFDSKKIASIRYGSIFVDRTGRELPP